MLLKPHVFKAEGRSVLCDHTWRKFSRFRDHLKHMPSIQHEVKSH